MTYVFHSILACFLSSSNLSVSLKTRIDNMSLENVLKQKRCPFYSFRVICVVCVFLCSVNVTSILWSQKKLQQKQYHTAENYHNQYKNSTSNFYAISITFVLRHNHLSQCSMMGVVLFDK